MKRERTWRDARRALGTTIALFLAALVVGANFVLVEVRLLGLALETRLGWALLVAAAFGFAGGRLHARSRRPSATTEFD